MIQDLWTSLLAFSATFIVPDWGALVSLIPLGLAALVVLYLTWTVVRFATAGPTSRGVRRVPPIAPPDIHMPGPSFAPFLAAFGMFMFLFGLFTGGPWMWIGIAVLVITLLYWGREALRDYDRTVHADNAPVTGALPAPTGGTPPEGVHIPPPSFRPLLIAVAVTLLVIGMVFGGWWLLIGVVAIAMTLLGWLRDSRREYAAVAAADQTGHHEQGGAPSWPKATFAVLALLVVGGLVATTSVIPDTGTAAPSGGPGASGGPVASGAAGGASAAPSLPAADAHLTAKNVTYLEKSITVPADKRFTLAFDNQDSVPHNVEIKDLSGASKFKGDIFSGPAVKVYDVPALAAGQYTFACTVHPNMTGTVTAQ